MRAYILTGPGEGGVFDVADPIADPGEVVVDVERVGVCGTDMEFFTGHMAYLDQGHASYPLRLGHEWCGRVSIVGEGVDPGWSGRRVTGDTMLGDRVCRRCRRGHQHVCENRQEVGIRGGRPGALAERIAVPAWSLHALPDSVDETAGALVEPGGNAWRAAAAAAAAEGDRVLVCGPGTIGLLTAMFLRVGGAEVHLLGRDRASLTLAETLGFDCLWEQNSLPKIPFDAIIDATNAVELPAQALDMVEPSGRIIYIGLAGQPSQIDTRLVALKDVTVVGILSASPGLAATVQAFAAGELDPRPLVGATLGLHDVHAVLGGWRPPDCGAGPKIHIDPRRL